MTPFPKNPFKPGAGRRPAHMGHRPEVEESLSQFLQTLQDDEPVMELGFLYGPRGNGKTVLLRWLHAEAAALDIATVPLVPERLESAVALASAVRAATERFPKLKQAIRGIHADVGGVRLGADFFDKSLPILVDILNRGEDGILLTLDEAHEVPPETLGRFLDAVQAAGEKRPIAAVLAGTPGLELTLLDAHASFWSRGRKLRIGLLSDDSAREVLARPFRDADLEADDGAVAELATAADNYPFFLQLYGRAAWDAVKASGGRTLLAEHVAPALAAARGRRQSYFRHRYQEFSRAELLPLARIVAEAFVGSAEAPADRRLSDAALEDMLTHCDDPQEAGAFLTATGFVWQDDPSGPYRIPGIPSLMDYLLENVPAR